MHHAGIGIGGERFTRLSASKVTRCLPHPCPLLAAHFAELGRAMRLAKQPERRARLDRLQLLRVTDQDHLRAGVSGFAQHPLELARADHAGLVDDQHVTRCRSEEHTSELQSLMRNSYAVFCLKKKTTRR